MKRLRIDDFEMPYVDIGPGQAGGAPVLVAVHGSLNDFRIWSACMGPLSRKRRLVVPSLRHFFPAHWDGTGPGFTIARHVADTIALLEALGPGPVDLLGHSRGGHIAFRVAQQRPDLVRRLVLAEPGGALDASLDPEGEAARLPQLRGHFEAAARTIAAGDVDGGLAGFMDASEGAGTWARMPEAARQMQRDNARTMLGQVNEARPPFTRADAEAVRTPTLLVAGAETTGVLPLVLRALARRMPDARTAVVEGAGHMMIEDQPVRFCAAVEAFLDA